MSRACGFGCDDEDEPAKINPRKHGNVMLPAERLFDASDAVGLTIPPLPAATDGLLSAFWCLRRALAEIEAKADGPAYSIALDALEQTDAVAEKMPAPK